MSELSSLAVDGRRLIRLLGIVAPPRPHGWEPQMVRRLVQERIDDLDGTSIAEETVTPDPRRQGAVELDLTSKHAQELRELLAPCIAAGRVTRAAGRHRRPSAATNDYDEVRAWCRSNGGPVSAQGRIGREALEAYDRRNEEGSSTLTAVS
jgi:hypothetical protein